MPLFVVDTCADTVEGQKRYLAAFFKDVFKLNGYLVVVGGTRQWTEIKRKETLNTLINRLRDSGRLMVLRQNEVDERERLLTARARERLGIIPTCCDDFHILAVCLLSDCRNVITGEQRLRDCVDEIRNVVGHDYCPQVRLIRDENTYFQLKNAGRL